MAKTCILCSNGSTLNRDLCYPCFKEYKQFKDEPWFREIATMQRKQEYINRIESYSADSLHHVINKNSGLLVRNSPGRPITNPLLVNKILEAYDNSIAQYELQLGDILTLRKLSKLSGISFRTVADILRKYRKEDYAKYAKVNSAKTNFK